MRQESSVSFQKHLTAKWRLKQLALAFTVLLKPMIESIDRYGLKSQFRKKYLVSVERLYRQISECNLQSETAVKVKERLEKNRDKLFTFLSYDGVPWNNNNAEHAVKPFAALRRIIGGVTTEKGLRGYLVLLSLCQTCRYMGVDFLDFLRSGAADESGGLAVPWSRRQTHRRLRVRFERPVTQACRNLTNYSTLLSVLRNNLVGFTPQPFRLDIHEQSSEDRPDGVLRTTALKRINSGEGRRSIKKRR
jgi:hypothetical protein